VDPIIGTEHHYRKSNEIAGHPIEIRISRLFFQEWSYINPNLLKSLPLVKRTAFTALRDSIETNNPRYK
jgi:hypothetical protein